ncbi:phospholipase A2 inhibitor 25 kDa subunit-like [Leptodactylus fuscus]|uniref:phospholipase A2 inhibitor 25 kDa subunit-like n=1 Tax=Leptodactylus fuscus TaxID=238119 RepID=UPI003F4EA0AC
MSSLTAILSLLFALAARSAALSCIECTESTGSSCTGNSVTCPSGSVCGSMYKETLIGKIKITVFERKCMASEYCNFKGSMVAEKAHVKLATSCCNTDDCTPTIPPFPAKNSNPNGLVCKTCISADSLWCESSDTVQCTGDENMCVFKTKKETGPNPVSTAIRGCATKSVCDLGSLSIKNAKSSTEIKFSCTGGGLTVHKAVLTPTIVCLLLLKFLS